MKSSLPLLSALALLGFAIASFAQDTAKTFTVQNGAFPWYDRVNVWALDNVPAKLEGGKPLPQQSCGSRSLEVPGTPKTILIGVSENDLANFKTKYPDAKETGDSIAVKNPTGDSIPYQVLSFPNPQPKIPFNGEAGLLLLRLDAGNAPAASPTPQASPTAPSSQP